VGLDPAVLVRLLAVIPVDCALDAAD